MKDLLRKLFSEDNSVSMMRAMSFMSLLTSIGIAFIGINKNPVDYSGLAMLTATFLGAAFGGKVLQKRIEVPALTGKSAITKIDDPDQEEASDSEVHKSRQRSGGRAPRSR